MPLKDSGAAEPRVIDRWDGGVGWIAYRDEGMQRASHAIESDGRAWLVDPIDANGLDDIVGQVGEVAGVVVLLDRHVRDAERLAIRHDVAVYVPDWLQSLRESLDVPVRPFRDELPGTGYHLRRTVDLPFWREGGLVSEGGDTVLVSDAIGTAEYFLAGDERLGVNPALRLLPPRNGLGDLAPDRVLVGHGPGVMEDAERALETALSTARRRAPRAYLSALAWVLP